MKKNPNILNQNYYFPLFFGLSLCFFVMSCTDNLKFEDSLFEEEYILSKSDNKNANERIHSYVTDFTKSMINVPTNLDELSRNEYDPEDEVNNQILLEIAEKLQNVVADDKLRKGIIDMAKEGNAEYVTLVTTK